MEFFKLYLLIGVIYEIVCWLTGIPILIDGLINCNDSWIDCIIIIVMFMLASAINIISFPIDIIIKNAYMVYPKFREWWDEN